jgi:allophanate hydrolase subunit 2
MPSAPFEASRPQPALLVAGDRVRFRPISAREFAARVARLAAAHHLASQQTRRTVIRPGLFTSIQDLGRPGRRHEGVTAGGAADAFSLRLLNLLVGNDETAGDLEFTLVGPTVRFERDTTVAVGGGKFGGLPAWQPCRIRAGTTLEFGPVTAGCRGYLAVAGGFDVPCALGRAGPSAAGGIRWWFRRPLAAGDQLPVGDENGALVSGSWRLDPRMLTSCDDPCILRVLPDADGAAFHGAAWAATVSGECQVGPDGCALEWTSLGGRRNC